MQKVSIGFDIGVASVGWSIYNLETKEVIDKGVKLFAQSNDASDRRNARGLRRRYKRKNHRIERFNNLLIKYNMKEENRVYNNLVDLRIKGLNHLIEEEELVSILKFLLRFRGYQPIGKDTRENEYKKNEKIEKKYACEIQKIILEEKGYYRGLDYPFLIEDFKKEIIKLLDTQIKYNDNLDQEFKKEYLKIFESRRKFWEGPGGARKDQLTPFGRYQNTEDLEELKKDSEYNKFLYENLIKNCSVYVGVKSSPVMNYYAQRFNFLNDMLNIKINYEDINEEYINKLIKIDSEGKVYKMRLDTINEIEQEIWNSKSINLDKIFEKIIGIKVEKIFGYRIDKKNKIDVTKYAEIKKIQNAINKKNIEFKIIDNIELWNEICYIGTVYPKNEIEEKFKKKFENNEYITDKLITVFSETSYEQKYHSFSEKALKKYIDVMENYCINSSTVETKYKNEIKSDVHDKLIKNYFNKKANNNMSFELIDDIVASPQVKKGLRKTIKTFNEIQKFLKDKYELEYVVVETATEALGADRKEEILKIQEINEDKRKKAIAEFGKDEKKILKHILLEEVNNFCIYCEKSINMENMETEHVLPLSKTADNSQDNIVASCYDCNHKKNDKTPYQFLSSQAWSEYQNRVTKNEKFSQDKKRNLLSKEDVNKYSKKFISRNLRDTAYTTKEFINQLKIYKDALKEKNVEFNENIKIVSMPPKITGVIRQRINEGIKDRGQQYHHAVDATIAAVYPTTKIGKLSAEIQNEPSKFFKSKLLDNEISNNIKLKYSDEIMKYLNEANYSNTRIHCEIKKKNNGQLANADMSKVLIKQEQKKKSYQKINYIRNIYDNSEKVIKKLKDLFKESSPKTLGIKYNDNPTYEYFKKILAEYAVSEIKFTDEKGKEKKINPFLHFCLDQHGIDEKEFKVQIHGIRPISKKNKERPVICKLRYAENVTEPYLLDKKTINKKETNFLMLDKMQMNHVQVYKDLDNNKFIFLPIYAVSTNIKTGEVIKNEYYNRFHKKVIGDKKVEFLMTLKTNQYIEVTKKNGSKIEGLVSGYHKTNDKIELKGKGACTPNDLDIKIIPIYRLGRYNVNYSK